jgi:hypothetical protein
LNFGEHDRISEIAHGGRGCEFIWEIPIEKESAKMPKYRIKVAPNTVVTAPARDIEYVSALALGWPVKPDKAEANYEHGLLRIEVPFKDPMEDRWRGNQDQGLAPKNTRKRPKVIVKYA